MGPVQDFFAYLRISKIFSFMLVLKNNLIVLIAICRSMIQQTLIFYIDGIRFSSQGLFFFPKDVHLSQHLLEGFLCSIELL